MTKPHIERRKYPRAGGVKDLTVGAEPHVPSVQVINLSLSGLCFRMNHPIEFMTRLMMTLVLPRPHASADRPLSSISVQCEGTVVRCDPVCEDNQTRYEAAVFFTHLDDTPRKAIEEYVETHT